MIQGWAFDFGMVMGSVPKFDYGIMGRRLRERRRHRSWPEELKREIVAASLEPGSSVSVVARRYDVNANQVFAWRKRYREPVSRAAPLQLVPVTVTPDRQCELSPASTSGLIEIELAGGHRVRVGNGVKASALRLVLDVLERR